MVEGVSPRLVRVNSTDTPESAILGPLIAGLSAKVDGRYRVISSRIPAVEADFISYTLLSLAW